MVEKATVAYGVRRNLGPDFDRAMEVLVNALKAEGFGILSTIDVQKTLKEKLGADFRRYVILGACNPPLAHRAFEAEIDIGLLLPCNVVLYEAEGKSVAAFVDPRVLAQVTGNPEVASVGEEARARLDRALAAAAEEYGA